MSKTMPDDYISAPEAAKILGVSRQRVLQLIHQKRLEATMVASVYLIKKADLANIEARKAGRPSAPKAAKASKASKATKVRKK